MLGKSYKGRPEAHKKVVVTNSVLSNTGDAAIYAGIVESLVQAKVAQHENIQVMDSDARATKRLYPQWRVHQQLAMPSYHDNRLFRVLESKARRALCEIIRRCPNSAPHLVRILNRVGLTDTATSLEVMVDADLIISSGGTYFVDHYNFKARIAELQMAAALGAEVVLWTQSLGPFKNARSRRAMKKLAGAVSAAYVRDEPSRIALSTVLPSLTKVHVAPDIAFVLTPREEKPETLQDSVSVVVSVRNWSSSVSGSAFSFGSYAHAMRSFATKLTETGASVYALSTCQGVEAYKVDDSVIAEQIFHDLPVEINNQHHSPDELLAELQKITLVVTTRMHLAILALAAGKPVIAIAYEFKTLELFKKLGLANNVCLIEQVSAEWLVERVQQALVDPAKFSLTLSERADLAYKASLPARCLADQPDSTTQQRA